MPSQPGVTQRRGLHVALSLMRRSSSSSSIGTSTSSSRESTPERSSIELAAAERARLQRARDEADERAVREELHQYEQLVVPRTAVTPEESFSAYGIDDDLLADLNFNLCYFWQVCPLHCIYRDLCVVVLTPRCSDS